MRKGPRAALVLLLAAAAPSCGKPPPDECPLHADAGAPKPSDAGAGDAGKDGGPTGDGGVDFCKTCVGPDRDGGAIGPGSCGTVSRAEIKEASGIAASVAHPGAFYLHNDSNSGARFFAVDEAGRDLGSYALDGATNLDWEDIAVGPCPAGSCVYIADTGDNDERRTDYVVYRVPEPFTLSAGDHSVTAEALPFAYPDGSHDAETLLVHPETGLITLVTKDRGSSGIAFIFAFPSSSPQAGSTTTLTSRGQITPPPSASDKSFTGGDVHPRGLGVLLRTNKDVFFFAMKPGQEVADALHGTPCPLPVAEEAQGEGIGWLASPREDAGSASSSVEGYVTVSEGESPSLNFVVCGPAVIPSAP